MLTRRIAVLVVEDEALLRLAVATALTGAGMEVFQASNAKEAIGRLEGNPGIRAVFSDVRMPGEIDGFALAKIIRDRWPDISVLLTTGDSKFSSTELPHGVRLFPKPYEIRQIIATIKDATEELAN